MASSAYAAITLTANAIPGWAVGERRFYSYDKALTCSQAQAQFGALSPAEMVAQTDSAAPAAGTGYHWLLRGCSSVGSDTDWLPDTDDGGDSYVTDSNPTGGTGTSGTTSVEPPAQPNLLDLRVQWINGQAEVTNAASPTASGSDHLYYFVDGSRDPITDAALIRRYPPRTWVNVYVAIGPRIDLYPDGFSTKAQQIIYIGNPPA